MPHGTVRWFDAERGFGFLALGDDAEDLFVHASEIVSDDAVKVLREGQEVEFEIGEGDRGPQARRVRVTGDGTTGAGLGVLGTVSWYEPAKGYGFIAPDDGGPEIFVHSSAVVGGGILAEGQRAAFLVVPGEKGPQADHLLPLRTDATASTRSDGADGTVSWFEAGKGFGFIAPDDGGPDVFVHVRSLAGGLDALSEGDRVSYDVVVGDKGPQARDVRTVGGTGRRGGSARGGYGRQGSGRGGYSDRGGHDSRGGRDTRSRDTRGGSDARVARGARGERGAGRPGEGVVTRFDAERGFGFIASDDGGPDVFVHVSAVRGADILEGDRVRFTVRQGERGPQADGVELA